MNWACYTQTPINLSGSFTQRKEPPPTLLPSLNLEWHPDNLPVVVFISLPLVLLFTPHASTETVSLMPSTSVSALAVNNPVVQSLWILFMLFFYFQLETRAHTYRCWMVRLHDKLFDSHHPASVSATTDKHNVPQIIGTTGDNTLIYNGVLSKWMQYQKCMADVYMRLHQ